MTCPEVAGKIPVIKLNRVVLPAPFGPMMALRSPGMILSVTSRTARRPPKLFESARSSRTGSPPFACASVFTSMSLPSASEATGAPETEPRPMAALVAEFAGREVAAVDRRLEELLLVELPELVDVRISLDDGVPELLLVVAEHLLLLDLLDVDVLHRVAHLVDADGTADGIQLQRGELFDEFLGTGEVALVVLDDLVDHLRRRVIGLRIVRGDLAVFRAVFLYEGFVLRVFQRGAVLQRGHVTDHFVAHGRQHELVIARRAADHRLLVARGRELLGELQRHGTDHERENGVGVLPNGRNVGPEVLGADRRPDPLDDLPAAGLECALEAADDLIAERIVGADRRDLLVALVAGPLPEWMARLRAAPAGADEVGILGQIALSQIVGGRNGRDIDGFVGGADRRQRVAARRQEAANEHMHLVLQDELLGPGDGGVRLGLFVLHDELHFRPAEVAVDVVKVELEAIDHILADLGEDAGGRRHISDA